MAALTQRASTDTAIAAGGHAAGTQRAVVVAQGVDDATLAYAGAGRGRACLLPASVTCACRTILAAFMRPARPTFAFLGGESSRQDPTRPATRRARAAGPAPASANRNRDVKSKKHLHLHYPPYSHVKSRTSCWPPAACCACARLRLKLFTFTPRPPCLCATNTVETGPAVSAVSGVTVSAEALTTLHTSDTLCSVGSYAQRAAHGEGVL